MRRALASTALLVAGALTALAALTGCGGAGDHTAADVDFARTMIRYHDQALAAARTADDRAGDPAVREVARRMRDAYEPQVDELIGLLRAWGALDADDPRGPDIGDAKRIADPPLPGLLSAEQTRELDGATGGAFDTLFLKSMIEHHHGALDTSRSELTGGANPGARTLSRRIVDVEGDTLATMEQLVRSR